MGVFERGFRIAVPEQPADGEYGLALPQGNAGMGMTKIVKTDVCTAPLRRGSQTRNGPANFYPTALRSGAPGRPTGRFARSRRGPFVPGRIARRFGALSCCRAGRDGLPGSRTSAASGFRSCGTPLGGEDGWPRLEAAFVRHGQTMLRTGGESRRRTGSAPSLSGDSAGCPGRGWSPRDEGPSLPPPS